MLGDMAVLMSAVALFGVREVGLEVFELYFEDMLFFLFVVN